VNKTLFKFSLKGNYQMWLIFFMIIMMYFTIIVGMFDPNQMDAFDQLLAMMPEDVINAMGFKLIEPTLVGFIAGYFYDFIMIMFPMIFSSILSFRMISKYVDNGSMAYLLSSPIKRRQVAITQAVFLVSSLWLLIIATTIVGIIFTASLFPEQLDISKFLLLNLGYLLLFLAISGIGFFFSCLFSEARLAISFGAGIPVGFFVINMLANASSNLEFLKYFTLFGLISTENIILGSGVLIWQYLGMLIIGLAGYITGIIVFQKKDLPL
jgi:ABC-2 type transport system permease protein